MQLPPVDRYANWRASAGDVRPVAVNRVQPVQSETAQVPSGKVASVRQLPAMPVKKTDDARGETVKTTDDAMHASAPEGQVSAAEVTNTPATVDVARTSQALHPSAPTAADNTKNAVGNAAIDAYNSVSKDAGVGASAPANVANAPSAQKAQAQSKPNSTNLAAQQPDVNPEPKPVEQVKPKEPPLSEVLIDFVQSLWSASRQTVDAAMELQAQGEEAKMQEQIKAEKEALAKQQAQLTALDQPTDSEQIASAVPPGDVSVTTEPASKAN